MLYSTGPRRINQHLKDKARTPFIVLLLHKSGPRLSLFAEVVCQILKFEYPWLSTQVFVQVRLVFHVCWKLSTEVIRQMCFLEMNVALHIVVEVLYTYYQFYYITLIRWVFRVRPYSNNFTTVKGAFLESIRLLKNY